MHQQFQFVLSKDEYVVGVAALTDQLGRQDTSRTSRLFEQIAVFVGTLAIIMVAFPGAVFGVLVAAVVLGLATSGLQARWLRRATGQSYDPAVAEHDVVIADEGISTNSELRRRQWSWPAVRRIHDLKQAILLEFVGWDMLVLPNRLWENSDERRAFLDTISSFAADVAPAPAPRKLASIPTRDLLTMGAVGASVDVLAVVVFALPAYRAATAPIGDAAFLGVFAAMLLLGLALAYFAFRFARRGLEQLYDSSPAVAISIAHVLIWAVPLYMFIAYFRWI